MAAIAAASRKISFDSADWNACAAPWKLTAKLGGRSISCSAWPIASTASPSDAPGARLNEMVVTGNCFRCEICSGEVLTLKLATDPSGVWPVVVAADGKYMESRDLNDTALDGS